MRSPRTILVSLAIAAGLLGWAAPAMAQNLTRGPYLQQANEKSVTVRWRTDVAGDSQVKYGTSQGTLNLTATSTTLTTEHIVQLNNLTADTKYYYTVGTTTKALTTSDGTYFFGSSPMPGVAKNTRVWVIGDFGNGSATQQQVRDAYNSFAGTRATDVWLMLGDNAYDSGTDAEYQSKVFNMYPTLFRKAVVWPTIGNHDAVNQSVYYNIFTLPTGGEAGGLASGTEHYYSFDYGNIHFICLDSQTSDRSATGPMATWVQSDANNTTKEWLVAFWHHPPYSYGTHDSDTDAQMTDMRSRFNPILEAAGVDLILTGHSHVYERSYLIDGHYGVGSTFTNAMKVDGGTGNPQYSKPAGTVAHKGAVYAVCGCSGQSGSLAKNHPAMVVKMGGVAGSMVLDINGSRMDAKFLKSDGTVQDTFAIVKGSSPPPPPAVTITATDAAASEAGPNTGTFTVSRGAAAASALTVNLTISGTATNGTDYATIPSTVTIPANSASATVTVTPTDDSSVETSETVIVAVAPGTGYAVGAPSTATVTIADNDMSTVTVTSGDPNASEAGPNNGTFTITRTGGSTVSALSVSVALSGTATNGTDYAQISSPVTIPAGASSVTVNVVPVDDASVEGNETAVLTVTAGGGYLVGGASSATVTIADNDGATDSDTDGLPDAWEMQYFKNLTHGAGEDADGDGLTNLQEYQHGTDPTKADTDGDGMADGWEVQYGLNPTSAADAGGDLDGDGFSNLEESQAGSDPTNPASVPASGSGGGGGGGGACGLTGGESLLALGLWALARRRRASL